MTPWYPMFFFGTMPNIFQWSNWAARPMFNFVLLRQKHAQSRQSWQTFLPKHTTEWFYPNISLNGWFYGQDVNTRTNCINTVFWKKWMKQPVQKNPKTRMCCQILHRHATSALTLQSIKWVRGHWVLACNLSKLDESSCTYLGRLCFYHNFLHGFFVNQLSHGGHPTSNCKHACVRFCANKQDGVEGDSHANFTVVASAASIQNHVWPWNSR